MVLNVTVVRAWGLRRLVNGGLCNPYCTVRIYGKPGSPFRTSVVEDSLDPWWDETVELQDYAKGDGLEFSVMDKNEGPSGDTSVGTVILDSAIFEQDGFQGPLSLEGGTSPGGVAPKLLVKIALVISATTVQSECEDVGPMGDVQPGIPLTGAGSADMANAEPEDFGVQKDHDAIPASSPNHALGTTAQQGPRPAVGSQVALLASGRIGCVTVDDQSDLPFKVVFTDGEQPDADWYSVAEVQCVQEEGYCAELDSAVQTASTDRLAQALPEDTHCTVHIEEKTTAVHAGMRGVAESESVSPEAAVPTEAVHESDSLEPAGALHGEGLEDNETTLASERAELQSQLDKAYEELGRFRGQLTREVERAEALDDEVQTLRAELTTREAQSAKAEEHLKKVARDTAALCDRHTQDLASLHAEVDEKDEVIKKLARGAEARSSAMAEEIATLRKQYESASRNQRQAVAELRELRQGRLVLEVTGSSCRQWGGARPAHGREVGDMLEGGDCLRQEVLGAATISGLGLGNCGPLVAIDRKLQDFVELILRRADLRLAIFGAWLLCHVLYISSLLSSRVAIPYGQ